VALKQVKVKKRPSRSKATTVALPSVSALLDWYDHNRRIMPWRALRGERPDPYRVWLSEVMLQQTMVATVGPYFQKFVKRWPTLDDLATASLDDVLRLWAGLGYYRRARMLHQCAQTLHAEHDGVFPSSEKALQALPGFGPYTTAAVRAIAFDKPANVVDGNVERVMARVFAIRDAMPKGKAKLREAAATLVPQERCGDYAQALMDLGATLCTPRSPKCDLCPWMKVCQARALGVQDTLPRRIKAKVKPVRRAVAFVLFNGKGELLLRRRAPHGLLAGMMEPPSSPWLEHDMPSLIASLPFAPVKAGWIVLPGLVTHVFSHFTLEVKVATAKGSMTSLGQVPGDWVLPENVESEAVPSVMKKIIKHALNAL
jgi:A/G-specific adenine glycosylase